MLSLSSVQEPESTHNGTCLAASRGNPMACRSQSRWEKLSGDDEGRSIGSEVGEEESEGVQDDEGDVVSSTEALWTWLSSQWVVVQSQDEHEERHEEEAHELNDPASDYVDEGDCEPVARDCGTKCYQRLRSADPENFFQSIHALGGG